MKKRTLSLVAMMASLALTSPLYAAGNNQNTTTNTTMMNQSREMHVDQFQSADKLLGMTIESKNGENIGEIQDLKIDTNTGRVNYVTVQVGGVLGIGGREGIAVPLEAFRFADDKAMLTVDQNKLNDVPKRADMSDSEFQRDLESHYGVSPAWKDHRTTSSPGMDAAKSSGHMNNTLENSNHMNNNNMMDNQQHMKMDPQQDINNNQKSQ